MDTTDNPEFKPFTNEFTEEETIRRRARAIAASKNLFRTDISKLDDAQVSGLYQATARALFQIEDPDGRVAFGKKAGDARTNVGLLRDFCKGNYRLIQDDEYESWRAMDEEQKFRYALERESKSNKAKSNLGGQRGAGLIETLAAGSTYSGVGLPAGAMATARRLAGPKVEEDANKQWNELARRSNYDSLTPEEQAAYRKDVIDDYEKKLSKRQVLATYLAATSDLSDRASTLLAKAYNTGTVDVEAMEALPDDQRDKAYTALSIMRGDQKKGHILGFQTDFTDDTAANRLQLCLYGFQQGILDLVPDTYELGKDVTKWAYAKFCLDDAERKRYIDRWDAQARAEQALKQGLPEADSWWGLGFQGAAESAALLVPYTGIGKGGKLMRAATAVNEDASWLKRTAAMLNPLRAGSKHRARAKLVEGVKAVEEAERADTFARLSQWKTVGGGDLTVGNPLLARQLANIENYTKELRELKKLSNADLAKWGLGAAEWSAGEATAFGSFAREYVETCDAAGISRYDSVPMAAVVGLVNAQIEHLYVPGLESTLSASEVKSLMVGSLFEAMKADGAKGFWKWLVNRVEKGVVEGVKVAATEGGLEEPLQQIVIEHGKAISATAQKLREEGRGDLADRLTAYLKATADTLGNDLNTFIDTTIDSLPSSVVFGATTIGNQTRRQRLHNVMTRHANKAKYAREVERAKANGEEIPAPPVMLSKSEDGSLRFNPDGVDYDVGIADMVGKAAATQKAVTDYWSGNGQEKEGEDVRLADALTAARKAWDAGDGDVWQKIADAAQVDMRTAEVIAEYFIAEDKAKLASPQIRAFVDFNLSTADMSEKTLERILPGYVKGSYKADERNGVYSGQVKLEDGSVKTIAYKVGDISGELMKAAEEQIKDGSELGDSHDERIRSGAERGGKLWAQMTEQERYAYALRGVNALAGGSGVVEMTDADGNVSRISADDVIYLSNGRFGDVGYGPMANLGTARHETWHAIWRFTKSTFTEDERRKLADKLGVDVSDPKWERKLDEAMAYQFELYASGAHVPHVTTGAIDRLMQSTAAKLIGHLSKLGLADEVKNAKTGKAFALADFYDAAMRGEIGTGRLGIAQVATEMPPQKAAEPQKKTRKELPVGVSEEELAEAERAAAEAAAGTAPETPENGKPVSDNAKPVSDNAKPESVNAAKTDYTLDSPANASVPDARFYRISAGDGVDLVGELVVSDARDLKTSYKGNLSDPSLQNRAETIEGRSLVEKIAGSPDPLQVGTVQPRANNGFVWTTPSLDTFIGNTRESGISAAYEKGNAAAVKAYMLAEAAKRGIEVPEGVGQPIVHFVLRRIESKDGKASIQDVVRMTNQSVNRGMNVYEQAKNDADVLAGAGLVPHIALRPDGRIDTAKSAEAIGRFILETVAQGMVDENLGTLTEDGQERLQNAVLAALLGNGNADTVAKMMRESDRLDIENEKRALMKTAAEIMRIAEEKPQYDLRQPLAEALDYYLNWRDVDELRREEAGKNRRDWYERTKDGVRKRGLTWAMHMGQGDMFRTPSPEARLLGDLLAASRDLRSFDGEDRETDAGKKRAQDLVTGFLGDYIRNADAVNTETADMFGTPPPSRIELLETHRGTDASRPAANDNGVRFSVARRLEEEREAIEAKGGELLLAHHGTDSRGFTRFEKSDDIGYFFAKSRKTAASYIRHGQRGDENKPGIPYYTDVLTYLNDEASGYTPEEVEAMSYEEKVRAYVEGTSEESGVYDVALKMEDPYRIDCHGANWNAIYEIPDGMEQRTYDRVILEFDPDVGKFKLMTRAYSEDGDGELETVEFDDFESFKKHVFENMGDTFAMDELEELEQKAQNDEYAMYEPIDGRQEKSEAGAMWTFDAMSGEGWGIYPKRTREIVEDAQNMGCDGVIFYNVVDNGGGIREADADDVYVVMKSEQVKSVDSMTYADDGSIIPAEKRFDWSNPDIRYSTIAANLSTESRLRRTNASTLTDSPAFKTWFVDSKVVDADGRPLKVYRGSPYDPLKQPAGKGVIKPEAYFTTDPEYARRYGKVNAYYLRIRKPFDIRNAEDAARLREFYPQGYQFAVGRNGALDWGEMANFDLDELREKYPEYDGIILDEGGDPQIDGSVKDRGVSYVPFDGGAQVKSATDNIGSFDPKNPDVRYSTVGEEGAWRLGVRNQEDAIRMEGEGASAIDVWKATGWFRGKDGKWRYEIRPITSLRAAGMKRMRNGETVSLRSVVYANELFRAYPDLADIKLEAGEQKGYFTAAGNKITYPKEVDKADTRSIIRLINHEVQHLIQNREGMSKGTGFGQLNNWANASMIAQREVARKHGVSERFLGIFGPYLSEVIEIANAAGIEGHPIFDRIRKPDEFYDWGWERQDAWEADHDRLRTEAIKEDVDFKDLLSKLPVESRAKIKKVVGDVIRQDKLLKEAAELAESRLYRERDWYNDAAGEVEARASGERALMSAKDRLATPPWESEDTPRDRQYIDFVRQDKSERMLNYVRYSTVAAAIDSLKDARTANSVTEAGEKLKSNGAVNKPLTNLTLGLTAKITGNGLSKMTSEKATKKSRSPYLHALAVANADKIFECAFADATHPDTHGRKEVLQVHRLGSMLYDPQAMRFEPVLVTMLEYKRDGEKVYTIEAIDVDAYQKKNSAGQLVAFANGERQTPIAEYIGIIAQHVRDFNHAEAVKRGDMATAARMVREAATKAGYINDSSYQGTSAFNGAAPSANGYYASKEERKAAWEDGSFEDTQTLGDYIFDGIDIGDLERRLDHRHWSNARPEHKEAIENLNEVLSAKSKTIRMYRSVPSDVKEGSFRNGDWITPSRSYAEENARIHGWGKKFRIIEQEVSVEDIWWDGNDIAEWGFDDGKESAYKNTKNNRKILAPATYDDAGRLIPLSKRFDPANPDVRYSTVGRFGAANLGIEGSLEASRMEEAGVDRVDIWRQTGWWRGNDGKWRVEVDPPYLADRSKFEFLKGGELVRLGELFPDSPVIRAYGLERIPVITDFDGERQVLNGSTAAYGFRINGEEGIVLDPGLVRNADTKPSAGQLHMLENFSPEYAAFSKEFWRIFNEYDKLGEEKADEQERKVREEFGATDAAKIFEDIRSENGKRFIPSERFLSVMTHEIQHIIQDREGFAKGGNPGLFGKDTSTAEIDDRIARLNAEIDKVAAAGEDREAFDRLRKEVRDAEAERLKVYNAAREKSILRYRHLAGEVEARNVEKRLKMPLEKRLATPPWETDDVKADDQIVRFSTATYLGGADLSIADNARYFKTWIANAEPAPMPPKLAEGTPKSALEWFLANMVGKRYEFEIPDVGRKVFVPKPGHIGKLVCGGKKKGIINKPYEGQWIDAVLRGDISAEDVNGWDYERARALPAVDSILTSFNAAVYDTSGDKPCIVFLKKFQRDDGKTNTLVMRIADDGDVIGPASAHPKDLTIAWLKNKKRLVVNKDGQLYGKGKDNSAFDAPLPKADAENQSNGSGAIIANPAASGNPPATTVSASAPRRSFSTVGAAYPGLNRLSDEQLIAVALASKTVFGKAGKKQSQHFTINEVQRHIKALHPDWDGPKVSLESTRIYQLVRQIQAKLREDVERGVSQSNILRHLPERLKEEFGSEMTQQARTGARIGTAHQRAVTLLEERKVKVVEDAVRVQSGVASQILENQYGVDLSRTLMNLADNPALKKDGQGNYLPPAESGLAPDGQPSGPAETSVAEKGVDEKVKNAVSEIVGKTQEELDRSEANRRSLSDQRGRDAEREAELAGEAGEASGLDPEGGDIVEIATRKAGVDLQNPRHLALFVTELARRHWVKEHGLAEDAEAFKDAVALQFLRKTAQDVYGKLVRDITYSQSRDSATAAINGFEHVPTLRGLISEMTFAGQLINARKIRETAQGMCEKLDTFLREKFGATGRFKPDNEELRRKVSTEMELRARYARHAIWLTPNAAGKEADLLQKEIDAAAADFDREDHDAGQSRVTVENIRKINILREFGGLRYKPLAQIQSALEYWDNAQQSEADQIGRENLEREIRTKKAAEVLAKAFRNPKTKYAKDGKALASAIDNYITGHMGFTHLLRDMMRYAPDDVAAAADEIVRYLELEIQKAGTRVMTQKRRHADALAKAVQRIYGRNFAKVLAEFCREDERFAEFMGETDGKKDMPTKGRAMQLMVSLLQVGRQVEVIDETDPERKKTKLEWQGGYHDNIVKHHREGQAAKIAALLSPQDLQLVKWLGNWYDTNRQELSSVCQDLFGIGVYAETSNYMPVKMRLDAQGLEKGDAVGWTIFPKALMPRVRNERDFDTRSDILQMFMARMEEGEQWKAHAKLGLEMRGIFGRSELQASVIASHGTKTNAVMLGFVTDILAGQGARQRAASGDSVENFTDWIRGWAALGALGGNVGVTFKQTTSIPAFGFEVGLVKTGRYMLTAFTPDGIAAMKKIWDSDERKNRWHVGNSEAVANALAGNDVSALKRFMRASMITNKIGDCVPGLVCGQGIYRDCIEQGMDEEDAMAKTWMLIERTQQSGRIENQAGFQRRTKFGRALYQFLTTQQQYLSYEARAIRSVVAKPGDLKRWGKLGETLILNHFLLSSAYFWMGQLYKRLLGQEPDEDGELADWMVSCLLGPYGALYGLGITTTEAINTWVKGRQFGTQGQLPSLSWASNFFVHDPARLVGACFSDEKTFDDVIDAAVKWASDSNAIIRDLRKVYRWRIKEEPQ